MPLVDFHNFWIGMSPNRPKSTCKISNSCFHFVMNCGRHRQTKKYLLLFIFCSRRGRIFIEELILGVFALLGCYSYVCYGRFGTTYRSILKGLVQEYSSLLGQLDPSRWDALLRNVGDKRNYAKQQSGSTPRRKREITQS